MSSSQHGCDTDWGCCKNGRLRALQHLAHQTPSCEGFAEEQHEKHYSQLAVLLSAEDYKDEFSSSTGSGGQTTSWL